MDFTYGLAVLLVIFEGIIIQCKVAGGAVFSYLSQNAPTDEKNKRTLPHDMTEKIFSDFDFQTINNAVRLMLISATNPVISRKLQNYIILIKTTEFDGGIHEYYQDGDLFLKFGVYQELISFFNKFGDQVKKIEFDNRHDMQHNENHKNIIYHIKRSAKHLEELRINTLDERTFWTDLSDEDNGINFPKVKKFHFDGVSRQREFKLNLIFPKLESFTLHGEVIDVNCLANVKGLKELMLRTNSINEDQYDKIFANNVNMTKICLLEPYRAKTMHSIAIYLTKLETLAVEFPSQMFLIRRNNNPVYSLPSVTHFDISNFKIDEQIVIENPSFDMPNLKKLTLRGVQTEDRIVNFIKHFENLESVELFVNQYNAVECMEDLSHIKEFMITFYEDEFESMHQFDLLKSMFEHFDKESKLQTLKFLHFNESLYQTYEDTMEEFNLHLKEIMQPTWKLSQEEQIGTGKMYLMFRREPCTYKSCKREVAFIS